MKNTSEQSPYLQNVKEIVSQCDRCGTCLTVCPLYGAKSVESSGARGKNNIIRGMLQGIVPADTAMLEAVNFCLLCRTCIDSCPNKVKTDDAMIAIRQYFAERNGTPGLKV